MAVEKIKCELCNDEVAKQCGENFRFLRKTMNESSELVASVEQARILSRDETEELGVSLDFQIPETGEVIDTIDLHTEIHRAQLNGLVLLQRALGCKLTAEEVELKLNLGNS